jgi:hypothetical protein
MTATAPPGPSALASGARAPTIAPFMSPRRPTLLLWLALLACAPVPFFLVERGSQPVAALLQMLGVTLVLMATEGRGGAAPLVAAMLAVHVLVAALVFAALASLVARGLVRVVGRRAGVAAFALAALMIVAAFVVPLYRTPFRSGGLQATLAEVFE